MVSHDKSEIYKLSSRLIELNDAKITYDGLPKLCIDSNLIEIKKQDDNYRAIFLINDIEVEVVLSKEEVYKLNPNL
jgi:ABC-type polysaccharide/polyol phosphate transport system ATPase subunit